MEEHVRVFPGKWIAQPTKKRDRLINNPYVFNLSYQRTPNLIRKCLLKIIEMNILRTTPYNRTEGVCTHEQISNKT